MSKSKIIQPERVHVWTEESFFFECAHCDEVNHLETRPEVGAKLVCDHCALEVVVESRDQ